MPDISDNNRNNPSPEYSLRYPAEQKMDSVFSPLLLTNWRMARSSPCTLRSHSFSARALTLHDFLLVAEPGRVLLLSCEELELISSSSSSSSSKFILLDIPSRMKRIRKTEETKRCQILLIFLMLIGTTEFVACDSNVPTSFTVRFNPSQRRCEASR